MTEMVYHIPTDEEMARIQLEARRMRAEAMRESFTSLGRAIRSLFVRPATREAH